MKKKDVTLSIPWPDLSDVWSFARKWLLPNPGTLVLMVILAVAIPALAGPMQAPGASSIATIPYQGRLADSGGTPVTAMANMEFRLYDVPSGGVPLWEELWTGGNSVAVSDGLFNVMLGSLNGTLASSIDGYDELYLGITVGTDSEMAPRVQLGSVPFSMQALTVPDGSITAEKLSPDIDLEPSEGSITSAMLGNSSVTTAKIADGAVTQVVQIIRDLDFTTTSREWVTIPGLETSFVLDATEVVIIQFSAGDARLSNDGAGGDFVIAVDGLPKVYSTMGLGGYRADVRSPVAITWVETLGPGTHYMSVGWRVSPYGSSSTFTLNQYGRPRLTITRFKR